MIAELFADMQSAFMRSPIRVLLGVTFLLITALRLPAPISEETTPSPKPKQESTPKPKPKVESTPKPKPTPNTSYAGTWSGNVVVTTSFDHSADHKDYLIRISDDEKTVWLNWNDAGKALSGNGFQAPCSRFGETLSWSLTVGGRVFTGALRNSGNGSAGFDSETRINDGDYAGQTLHYVGTLTKAGVFVATDAASPPTTEAVAQPTPKARKGGLPVAQPVPNKPGYVYNPFDPTSKILVNVNGIRSGSRAKEPSTGKLFIVP